MNMRRLLAGLIVALGLSVTLSANFYNFEQITVDATAGGKGFTAALITPSGQPPMTLVTCRLRTAEVSYLWVDPSKTAVTASVGMLLEPGEIITLTSREQITNFRAIRTGATSGQLDCTYMVVN